MAVLYSADNIMKVVSNEDNNGDSYCDSLTSESDDMFEMENNNEEFEE